MGGHQLGHREIGGEPVRHPVVRAMTEQLLGAPVLVVTTPGLGTLKRLGWRAVSLGGAIVLRPARHQ